MTSKVPAETKYNLKISQSACPEHVTRQKTCGKFILKVCRKVRIKNISPEMTPMVKLMLQICHKVLVKEVRMTVAPKKSGC